MSFDLLDQVEKNLVVKRTSVVEFAESDQFCDKSLYPRQKVLLKLIFLEELTNAEEDILDHWIRGGRMDNEITISPNIRERVQYLRENEYNHFREITLVGGRRSSKGFVTGIALAKVMYDTLQLQDPGRHYGIDPTKAIYFSCVAGSEAQAKEFQFADFVSTVQTCKAFEPYLNATLETEFRVATSEDLRQMQRARTRSNKLDRDISKLRGKALAANAGTLRGSTTMALCIDEMAHMIPGTSKSSADEVYKAATPSIDQFGKDGMIFLNSSPYSKVGMFHDRFVHAMREYNPALEPDEVVEGNKASDTLVNGTPTEFTFQYPSWALFEGYQDDPKKRFSHVITASADWDKFEKNPDGTEKWSSDDQALIQIAKSKEASNPEAYKVENRGKFAEVTDAYLNPAMVDRVFKGAPNGFDSLNRMKVVPLETNWGTGATNLFQYKAHLDPSSTTAGFGFALAHGEVHPDKDGEPVEHVVFDIIKRWNPKDFPGQTISWQAVIAEVLTYINIFRPYEVTFDQFQSAEPVQTLKYQCMELGIEGINIYVKTATLEHNWFRAETFKTAINHSLVHAPSDTDDLELACNELKFLQQMNTSGRYPRVDKQDFGPVQTKDMADCMMECVNSIIGNQLQTLMRQRATAAVMAPGSQGGFRIGGIQQPSLADIHPDLAGYYGGSKRLGEQRDFGYNTIPHRGVVGGASRGISRGSRRSRGRG